MKLDVKPLARPLLILGGYVDLFGVHQKLATSTGKRLTGTIIPVGFLDCGSFEECQLKLLDAINQACPHPSPTETVEVDVLGYSMGGLLARYAANPPADAPGPRLRIKRLFTISSPHRGADLASVIAPGQLAQSMKPDAPVIRDLIASEGKLSYELYPYVRIDDPVIGNERSAPEGESPWWVDGGPAEHIAAAGDARIRADIFRRLRGEKPHTTEPRAKLPPEERKEEAPHGHAVLKTSTTRFV
jgi:pimeloyl-ACP methyl ester carboxylesterase